MKKRNLWLGLGWFVLALAIGAVLMYRFTHSGHMGIGPECVKRYISTAIYQFNK